MSQGIVLPNENATRGEQSFRTVRLETERLGS